MQAGIVAVEVVEDDFVKNTGIIRGLRDCSILTPIWRFAEKRNMAARLWRKLQALRPDAVSGVGSAQQTSPDLKGTWSGFAILNHLGKPTVPLR
jgi:hypothetical protein